MRFLFSIIALAVLAGCASREMATLNRGVTADDKEVTARNLASCREQANAARLSADSPPYSRFVDECMKKGGVVEQTTR